MYIYRTFCNIYSSYSLIYAAREAFKPTLLKAIQFFFLFFLPNIGKHLGASMLGNYMNYFRNVFWDSMDNRKITKAKRGDLIDSLLQLKDEKPDNTNFREYLVSNINMY